MSRRRPSGTLLLAGLAAYAYYKYSKMNPEEKRKLVDGLKEKGKQLYDQYVPADIKNKLAGQENTTNNNFEEGSAYSS